MQIKETLNKGLKREYAVVVPASEIEAQTEVKLKEVSQKVKVSGFRAGHVPMKLLKQRYGKSVLGEVLEAVVHKASHDVVDKNKLRPALQPDIKVTSFDEGKDLELTISMEVFPEVKDVDLKKITVEKPVYEIGEKDVEEAISRFAERNKERKVKGDKAKAVKGDVVKIDFKGLKDGVAFEGGTAEGFSLELGSGHFIPGFEDQLIGAKKGDEVKVEVSFPAEYHAKDLAGQPVVFEVKVHEVLESIAPAIDDEFAKKVGFENLDALKASFKEHIAKDYDGFVRNLMKKELFDKLEDVCDFDVPEGMVEAEFKQIWAKLKQAQAQGDPSVSGKDDKALEEEYRAISLRRVRLGVFLAELGRKQNVQVNQQELMNAVVEQARQYPGQEHKVIEFYQKNPAHVEELRGPIFEDKVVDYILTQVKATEKKVSLEDLLKMDLEEEEVKPAKKAAKKSSKKEVEAQADEAEEVTAEDAEKAPAKKKTAAKK